MATAFVVIIVLIGRLYTKQPNSQTINQTIKPQVEVMHEKG